MIIYIMAGISMACALAVLYPYVIYPALLFCFRKKAVERGVVECGDGSDFSLLFCAYNEGRVMPAKLANLRDLKKRYPGMEFLAFDDGSSDGTADIIEREAPFVRLFRGSGRSGKAHGMKLMASQAKGKYLIFTDANVLLELESPVALSSCYADTGVGGVCGALHYLGSEGSSTAAVGGFYWRLEEKIKDLESATGNVMGADGSIFSIRSELYPDFPDTVLDDFTVSMEVVFRGKRLIKCNEVIAYEQLVSSRSDEFARKIRIAARAFHTHMILAEKRSKLPAKDRFRYFSHKTLRWFGGGFLLLGAIAGLTAIALASLWGGVAAFMFLLLVILLGARARKGYMSSAFEVVLALLATIIGVGRAVRGQTFAVWNPAKSR